MMKPSPPPCPTAKTPLYSVPSSAPSEGGETAHVHWFVWTKIIYRPSKFTWRHVLLTQVPKFPVLPRGLSSGPMTRFLLLIRYCIFRFCPEARYVGLNKAGQSFFITVRGTAIRSLYRVNYLCWFIVRVLSGRLRSLFDPTAKEPPIILLLGSQLLLSSYPWLF